VFEERIGCLSDPPPPLAEEFIVVLGKIMKYIQLLMFGAPLYKIYPTKTWKMFVNALDNSYRLGHTFINKVNLQFKFVAIQCLTDINILIYLWEFMFIYST